MGDKLKYGVTSARERGIVKQKEGTWQQIVELFKKPVRRNVTTAQYQALPGRERASNKNTGLFFGGECAEDHRGSDDLLSRTIVNLDLDEHCADIWQEFKDTGAISALAGCAYLVHSTRSHTDAEPRFRIYLPLKSPVSPAAYAPITRGLAEMLDSGMLAVSRESFTPAQGMYFPSVSSDQEYHFASIDGEPFDPMPLLEKYPANDASKWPKRPKEVVSEYSPNRRMTHPEEKKTLAPIITAVHRAWDPHTFIEEFLGDVYAPAGERYRPHNATGVASVRVYDDAFIHSDHGASDPAYGQHNTFDLGRIHLFGELDQDFDTDGMSPAEWPSYKAMAEWALEHEIVREQLAEIEEEVEGERNQVVSDMLDELDDEPEPDDTATDDEDLIGGEPAKKKAPTTEEILRKVKRKIAKADSLSDLERRVDVIRALPIDSFRDLHRDLVAPDLQNKFAELTGEKITKAQARKMLAPTVEDLARQFEGKEPPAWLKPWVYLSQDNKFMHLETKELLPKEGFNARFMPEALDVAGPNSLGLPRISASELAWLGFQIPKPYSTRYLPGAAALFEENSCLYANTYRAPIVESGGYKGNEGLKQLKRLLEDLFPEREHRCMIMDFLVHCVRFPEKKLMYALLIKGAENEGKTLLANLVSALVGESNRGLIGSESLMEKFNSWAHEKVFCVIEEVKIPGREVETVLNKLKQVITNDSIPIRRMQKDITTERNFCNLYMTTNDEDALRMRIDDTRYLVLFTRFRNNDEVKAWHAQLLKDEGKVYVRELYEHIKHRPAQFLDAFAKYKFSEFYDPDGRAPMTIFRQIMAEDNKTDEHSLLEDTLASGDVPGVTPDILVWSVFREMLDSRDMAPHIKNSGVGKFLRPFGFVRAAPFSEKINGKVVRRRVWTKNLDLLESNNELSNEGRTLLKAELEKIETLDDPEDLKSLV